MRTFSLAEPTAVTITTCKSPDSLSGAPFLNNRVLSADHEEVVFSRDARAAVEAFPKNVNVAISTALACDAIDTLKVCVLSEPKISCNAHTIVLSNSFADAAIRISSRPDSGNPRSSVITAWSIAALLQNLANTVQYF